MALQKNYIMGKSAKYNKCNSADNKGKGGDTMSDKKRNGKKHRMGDKSTLSHSPQTFDDQLEQIKQQTLSAVVEREIYPRGDNRKSADDTKIYYTAKQRYDKTGRYEESPDTVAQHMEDRTQFRH